MPRYWFMTFTVAAAAALAACSGAKSEDDQSIVKQGAGDESLPTALSGEAGFAMAADCSAKLKSLSSLYGALAKRSSGAEAEDFAKRAAQRESAATAFAQIAERAGGTIGKTSDQAAQAIRDADAAVQAEFEKRPFEDFAAWVGNEVDTKCRKALTGRS